MSMPEAEESATMVDVYTGCASLGVSIVGGIDTPLVAFPAFLTALSIVRYDTTCLACDEKLTGDRTEP